MTAPDLHPDEWQLWRIPEAERRAALRHELNRSHFSDLIPDGWGQPWLSAAPEDRKTWKTDCCGLAPVGLDAIDHLPRPGEPSNSIGIIGGMGFVDPRKRLASILKGNVPVFAFAIDPEAPRKSIVEEFSTWLEENGIGKAEVGLGRGKMRENLIDDYLKWLALWRLRKAGNSFEECFRALAGTPFDPVGAIDRKTAVDYAVERWFPAIETLISESYRIEELG
ncbi:MAG: hypothetical protein JJT96_10070 [Opitutales bacterium]|nr:hypothetical protein [Opitutales bacterium]